MDDVGGTLAFDDVALTGQLPAGRPAFIPQVNGSDVTGLDEHLNWPAYAVGLRRVCSPTTHALYPRFTGGADVHRRGLGRDRLIQKTHDGDR